MAKALSEAEAAPDDRRDLFGYGFHNQQIMNEGYMLQKIKTFFLLSVVIVAGAMIAIHSSKETSKDSSPVSSDFYEGSEEEAWPSSSKTEKQKPSCKPDSKSGYS